MKSINTRHLKFLDRHIRKKFESLSQLYCTFHNRKIEKDSFILLLFYCEKFIDRKKILRTQYTKTLILYITAARSN